VVVDERLARRAWPGRDAIGQRLQVDFVTDEGFVPTWARVVGVVRHIRHRDLTEVVREQVYVPHRQSPRNPIAWAVHTKGAAVEEATRRRGRADPGSEESALCRVSARPLHLRGGSRRPRGRAALATWARAGRATRFEPIEVLRSE
jgi:hypothetical protein